MKTKLLIVEPSEVIRQGLATILHGYPRFRLLDMATEVEELSSRLLVTRPDVLLLNPTLVDDPLTLCAGEDDRPALVALVYQYVEQYKLRRYDGVVDIRDGGAAIVATLQEAAAAHEQGDYDMPATAALELSKRERSVIVLVAKGLTNKEIAEQLNVSPHTVMSHRKNIMRKTGIKSVAGLTVYAMLNHLIEESALV